jgi:hypothetical protein
MAIQEKQFGQARPSDINAVSIYSPVSSGTTGIVLFINICNVTTSPANYSIYQDDNGSTYSENTAIHYNQTIAAETTVQLQVWLPMNDINGNLGVQTSIANALTFTVSGTEMT